MKNIVGKQVRGGEERGKNQNQVVKNLSIA